MGKASLAAQGEAAIDTYVRTHPCPQLTTTTLITADALRREAEAIRRQGWACDDEECERGVGCFAVPAGAPPPPPSVPLGSVHCLLFEVFQAHHAQGFDTGGG